MADEQNNFGSPQHEHLWIPEGEIELKSNKPTGREKPRDVRHGEHGDRLLGAVTAVERVHRERSSTLDDTLVFKMTLAEKEKFQNRARQEFLEANHIRLNAVRNERTAVVSISGEDLGRLKRRLEQYKAHDRYDDFQYVDTFAAVTKEERQSLELRRLLASGTEDSLDVQIQLLPNLGAVTYGLVVARLNQIVQDEGGNAADEPFYMSNQTPVLHYFMPASAVDVLSEDDAVYRIEITPSYEFQTPTGPRLPPDRIQLDSGIAIDDLPVVGVVDTGVEFPGPLAPLLLGEWTAPDLAGTNRAHGTMVASRAAFGDSLRDQIDRGVLRPRARIYSLRVSDGQRISGPVLMRHIQAAVEALPPDVRIVNVSINQVTTTVVDDAMSIFANLLDVLSVTHGVTFVVSAGNQQVWLHATDNEEAFTQEEARITSPAESYFAITTGAAVVEADGLNVAPYSRRGPGFAGNMKVNLLAEGGGASIGPDGRAVPTDPAWAVDHLGGIHQVNGTSFAAPIVAGDLAEVAADLPNGDLLLAKALLIHTAAPLPGYDLDGYDPDTRAFLQQIIGNGVSDPARAKLSSKASVTFVARGTLNRTTKARVNFFVPALLQAGGVRQPLVTLKVTCVSLPPIDYTKGMEYLGACVTASLHGMNTRRTEKTYNPAGEEGRAKWQPIQHFVVPGLKAFSSGTWQVWLELMTRWETKTDQEIPYALAITVEDPGGTLDVYNAIQVEAENRFQPMTRTRVRR